jgi:predicted RNA-binding Zn ribbon-like protein
MSWGQYLSGAFAMANAFGPEWTSGRRNMMRDEPTPETAVIEALSVSTAFPPDSLSADAVELLVETGKSLWSVFDHVAGGRTDDGIAILNEMLDGSNARPTLTRHGPANHWHLHFSPHGADLGRRWASDFTIATAMLVGSVAFSRIGKCAAERCDRVFYDDTRNASQSFCSVQCQSRMKMAAMRRRQRAAAAQMPEGLTVG